MIGFGAIARTVIRLLRQEKNAVLQSVVVRDASVARVAGQVDVPVFSRMDAALALKPTLVLECAGHGGLGEHGCAVLNSGVDLLVASVGALAHPEIENRLREAAQAGRAQVLIPAGALGGLDALGAARYAGLEVVKYTSTKAVAAWRGTHAEKLVRLDSLDRATTFYTGNAREAAQLFPQNANVAAAVALAGCGFERTQVALTADPAATGNRHFIQACGVFGNIDVIVEGRVLPENPKTSMLAPMSMVRAIDSRVAALRIL